MEPIDSDIVFTQEIHQIKKKYVYFWYVEFLKTVSMLFCYDFALSYLNLSFEKKIYNLLHNYHW